MEKRIYFSLAMVATITAILTASLVAWLFSMYIIPILTMVIMIWLIKSYP